MIKMIDHILPGPCMLPIRFLNIFLLNHSAITTGKHVFAEFRDLTALFGF
jgi:hypothetical protein